MNQTILFWVWRNRLLRTLLLLSLSGAAGTAATVPGIVSFSANLSFPGTTPASLRSGSLESNTTAFGFLEKAYYVLPTALPVDVVVDGAANYDGILDLNPGSLTAGMSINSYLLHFDPVGFLAINRNPGTVQIQFADDFRIAGLQVTMTRLNDAANAQLKIPGVTYENRLLTAFGLELIASDWVHVTSHNTLGINLNSSLGTLDQIRILVETPEPTSALLFGSAVALLLWTRRSTTARRTPGSTSSSGSGL
jgi:hypothetical protein